MRRHTAALLLVLSVFSAVAAYGPDPDRSFFGRIRNVIQRIARHIGPNGDWLTPPKP
jgi:hypothetical protein